MLNIVQFGRAVFLEDYFLSISLYVIIKSLRPWGGAMHDPRDFI